MAFTSAYASEGKTKSEAAARQELISEISEVVSGVPFGDYIGREGVCRVAITFKVSEDSELTDFIVTSDNKELSNYLQISLNRSHLKVDPMLNNINYRIKVKYENYAVL